MAGLCLSPPAHVLAQQPPVSVRHAGVHAAASSPSGQGSTANGNTAQAVLHITATIVPVAMVPQKATASVAKSANYVDVPTRTLQMDVRSERHPYASQDHAVLETTTVVPR
jgi:hypothetical protein